MDSGIYMEKTEIHMKIIVQRLHCFHPEGKDEPVSICYMRGMYWKEVRDNMQKFTLSQDDAFGAAIIIPSGAGHKHGRGCPLRFAAFQTKGRFTGTFIFRGYRFDSESAYFVLSPPRSIFGALLGRRAYVKRALKEFSRFYVTPAVAKISDGRMYISYPANSSGPSEK